MQAGVCHEYDFGMNKNGSARGKGGRKAAPPDTTRIKIAVSLPREQVAGAQHAVNEGRAPSVSAYISRALEQQGSADSLTELVALMRAEDGPPSTDDYAWADSVLGIASASRRSTRRGGKAR